MIINHKMWNAGPVVVFPRRGSTLGHFGYDSVGSLGKILTSFVARWFLMFLSIVSTWLLQFVPSKVSTFSRIMHKIHLNCPHVIPNPFLILSHFFPHSTIIPQTLHRAQGHWRAAPRSAAARAETLQAIGAGTGGTSFCAGGTEGRAEWEDGDEIMGKMDQWRGWSNNERRWGYRADFILSFLMWNSLPEPLGLALDLYSFWRSQMGLYGVDIEGSGLRWTT